MKFPTKHLLAASVAGVVAATGALSVTPAAVTPSASAAVPAAPVKTKLIGMSAPSHLWEKRIKEVGAKGIKARRIFATLSADGKAQSSLIRDAVADGQMPVVSYKVPDVNRLIDGDYDSWLRATKRYLRGLDKQVTVTFWHEPYGDMKPAEFRAGSRKFLKLVQAPRIAVGPILNGWLLDRKVSDFASFTSKPLLRRWDFVAVDSYQDGTAANPGKHLPARAVPLLAKWLDRQGFPKKPIGLGEYNGHTAAAMKSARKAILSTPELWFALAWNSNLDPYSPLEGGRLKQFKRTKADQRAAK